MDVVSLETCDVSLGPKSPRRHEYSKDDIAISSGTFRQVDYLSHHWEEEDIWPSWRHIVIRRGTLLDQVRLENAAWRTWAKVKNSLKTVHPEILNWRKDDDITWLYGPLHLIQNPFGMIQVDGHRLPLGNTASYRQVITKPILKRRSRSEDMSFQSSSILSLVDRPTPSVDIQNTGTLCIPPLNGSRTPNQSERYPKWQQSQDSNNPSQFADSPKAEPASRELKRTRFNELVEQCVIVDSHGPEHDYNQPDHSLYRSDSGSDDSIVMQCINGRTLPVSQQQTSESMMYKGKRISMLPSTALKSGYDTPEPCRGAVQYSPVPISPLQDISPAGETMAVSVGTGGADDSLQDVSPGSATARSSQSPQGATGDLHRSSCSNGRSKEGFMSSRYKPHEEERASPRGGFIDLLGEAITSIRDITYAIRNSIQ